MMSSGGYTTIDDNNNKNSVVSGSVPVMCFFFLFHGGGEILFLLDSFSKPARGISDGPRPTGWMHAFTVGAYTPYFDVDTSDVLQRIRDSLFPFSGTFTENTADNPDLYVPHLLT
ncbi:hypothetical protein BHE74_00057627 [Ensete ventricosum]|nr:hypothetical protein GW17_00060816 [Ensete ventricosum]RWW37287.1 hypothetical protein BHE74_00057627 [Ensete ventricosum]RZR84055.1 hypothetical protein BHM03_00010832 [Ensete ventricosum]